MQHAYWYCHAILCARLLSTILDQVLSTLTIVEKTHFNNLLAGILREFTSS